jgi:hypothetical protein
MGSLGILFFFGCFLFFSIEFGGGTVVDKEEWVILNDNIIYYSIGVLINAVGRNGSIFGDGE